MCKIDSGDKTLASMTQWNFIPSSKMPQYNLPTWCEKKMLTRDVLMCHAPGCWRLACVQLEIQNIWKDIYFKYFKIIYWLVNWKFYDFVYSNLIYISSFNSIQMTQLFVLIEISICRSYNVLTEACILYFTCVQKKE